MIHRLSWLPALPTTRPLRAGRRRTNSHLQEHCPSIHILPTNVKQTPIKVSIEQSRRQRRSRRMGVSNHVEQQQPACDAPRVHQLYLGQHQVCSIAIWLYARQLDDVFWCRPSWKDTCQGVTGGPLMKESSGQEADRLCGELGHWLC